MPLKDRPDPPTSPGRGPGAAGERQQREIDHWRRWQSRADTVWGWQTPAGQARADRRAQLFRDRARIQPSTRALELGCGTGEFTLRIAPHCAELLAIDLSPELLQRAQTRVSAHALETRVRFEIQDAMQLSVPSASCDVVFGCSVLHHLDAARALGEIFRVLRPGGRMVFSEPNMLNPQIALQKNVRFIKERVGDTPDETAFFAGPMRGMLAGTGFTEIQVMPFDFLHPLTPRAWIRTIDGVGRLLERIPWVRGIAGSLLISAAAPAGGASARG